MIGESSSEEQKGGFQSLVDIIARLRGPGGCPWDQEQTHASLKRNLLEEAYEVLEAIDSGDGDSLCEELGDLLVQIAFHAQIAQEYNEFNFDKVIGRINQKLVRRHPHVFGDTSVADAGEVERNWEALKEAERGERGVKKSPADGIPQDLPALAYAQLMQDRVGRAGFEWEDISGVLDKLVEEVEELRQAPDLQQKALELGDVFFTLVNLSRWLNLQAEDALRQANRRFLSRYTQMEELAANRGLEFPQLPLAEKGKLWQEAKQGERDS